MHSRKPAFTLSEVLISMVLIGILVVVMLSITNFSDKDEKILIGKKQQAESLIVSVSKALASGDTTGLALTALTQSDDSLRDGFAPKLNTKNAQAFVDDFSDYNTPEEFLKPEILPAVELVNGTKVAFQKLNNSCSRLADGGAPCALAYVDVNKKSVGDEKAKFMMVIYRDRAASEYELCQGYDSNGQKFITLECPQDKPNGTSTRIDTCSLGVVAIGEPEGTCCPSDQTPDGGICVCKNSDMESVGGICVCKDHKVNINGACICEGKEEACPEGSNKIGKLIYDGVCKSEGKSFELRKNTCKCPDSLPNESLENVCYAACSGDKIWDAASAACKCPANLPDLANGKCTCSDMVEDCPGLKVGNITYSAICSATGKVKDKVKTNTCACPTTGVNSKAGCNGIFNSSTCTCEACTPPKVPNAAKTACVCPANLPNLVNGVCTCPDMVESCPVPKVGNITYSAICSATGKVKDKVKTNTCACPTTGVNSKAGCNGI
ncbi:MAG: type II secretion system protein, partial [Candidatus Gastranaerophilales bacterium]|nr:type II secretion system protein [Candidatus Gastranaerophilales bacterium]